MGGGGGPQTEAADSIRREGQRHHLPQGSRRGRGHPEAREGARHHAHCAAGGRAATPGSRPLRGEPQLLSHSALFPGGSPTPGSPPPGLEGCGGWGALHRRTRKAPAHPGTTRTPGCPLTGRACLLLSASCRPGRTWGVSDFTGTTLISPGSPYPPHCSELLSSTVSMAPSVTPHLSGAFLLHATHPCILRPSDAADAPPTGPERPPLPGCPSPPLSFPLPGHPGSEVRCRH